MSGSTSDAKRKLEEISAIPAGGPQKVVFSFDIEGRGDDLLAHGILAIGWCVGSLDDDRVLETGRVALQPLVTLRMHTASDGTPFPGAEVQTFEQKCLDEFWYNEEKCPGGRAKLDMLKAAAIDPSEAMRIFRDKLDFYDDGERYEAVIVSDNILFDGGWVDFYLSYFGLRRLHLTPQGRYRRVFDMVDYRRGLVKMDHGDRWLNERGIIELFGLTVDPDDHTHLPEEDARYIYRFYQQLLAKAAIAYDQEEH